MLSLLRSMVVLGGAQDEADVLCRSLRASDVPVSTADCRACSNPCDLGHEAYPRRFDVDFASRMLGSVKPYHRQVVISTAKSDWSRDISDDKDSLAAALSDVAADHGKLAGPLSSSPQVPGAFISASKSKVLKATSTSNSSPTGVFSSSDSTRISILNGSHRTLSCEEHSETVLVFPDYLCVTEVRRCLNGARALWREALQPDPEGGQKMDKRHLKSWVLPYASVVLLCSHRKRDNRCGIAAPKLEHAFIKALEAHGWEADVHLEHPELTYGPALEDASSSSEAMDGDSDGEGKLDWATAGIGSIELEQDLIAPIPLEFSDSGFADTTTTTSPIPKGPTTTITMPGRTGAIPISRVGNGVRIGKATKNASRRATMAHQLKESAASKRVLIIKVSHIGGHRYAGNAVIYQPSGSGIWYGRVTPHDVDSIVTNTIIEGLILPPLLRGGLNLTRPNCKTLNDCFSIGSDATLGSIYLVFNDPLILAPACFAVLLHRLA